MSQLKNKKNMENFGLNFVHQILSSSNFKCTSTLMIIRKKLLFKSITITVKLKCKQEFYIGGYMNSMKCYKESVATAMLLHVSSFLVDVPVSFDEGNYHKTIKRINSLGICT